jgi:hypothetical protein
LGLVEPQGWVSADRQIVQSLRDALFVEGVTGLVRGRVDRRHEFVGDGPGRLTDIALAYARGERVRRDVQTSGLDVEAQL